MKHTIETQALTAVFCDNAAYGQHLAGYNGVSELSVRGLGGNIFVPPYCGMNYELTEFDGYAQDEECLFEPRRLPMEMMVAGPAGVTLYQPPTPQKGIEARIDFHMSEHYIHQRIQITFHKQLLPVMNFKALLASYFYVPQNGLCYLHIDKTDPLGGWMGVRKKVHGAPDYFAHPLPARELSVQEHLDIARTAPESLLKFDTLQSYYYGLYGDFAVIMMFRDADRVAFISSPTGGGTEPANSPAWDYVLLAPDAKLHTPYTWEVCMAIKPYAGRADILAEVARYAASPRMESF